MSTIQIERIRGLERVDEIAGLFDSYRQFYGQKCDRAAARDFIQRRLEAGESAVFAAFVHDEWRDERRDERREGRREAAGFMQLYPAFSSISMERAWILNDLYVSERFRRRAVARSLLMAAANFARETGAAELTLKTAQGNAAARGLYESLGWRLDSEYVSYDLRCDANPPSA